MASDQDNTGDTSTEHSTDFGANPPADTGTSALADAEDRSGEQSSRRAPKRWPNGRFRSRAASPAEPVGHAEDSNRSEQCESTDNAGAAARAATGQTPSAAQPSTDTALLDIRADNIISEHIIANMALGLVPLPLLDIATLTAAQYELIERLASLYGIDPTRPRRRLLAALVSASLPVAGVAGVSSLLKILPGFGSLGGGAALAVTAGAVSYATGRVVQGHFAAGGGIDDLNPGVVRERFRREYETGKRYVRAHLG